MNFLSIRKRPSRRSPPRSLPEDAPRSAATSAGKQVPRIGRSRASPTRRVGPAADHSLRTPGPAPRPRIARSLRRSPRRTISPRRPALPACPVGGPYTPRSSRRFEANDSRVVAEESTVPRVEEIEHVRLQRPRATGVSGSSARGLEQAGGPARPRLRARFSRAPPSLSSSPCGRVRARGCARPLSGSSPADR